MKTYEVLLYLIAAICGGTCGLMASEAVHAEMNIGGMKYCQDVHGSTYTVRYEDKCGNDPLAYGHTTPEYMYTDRETMRLEIALDALSAQAQEQIARGYGGSGNVNGNITGINNDVSSESNSRASNTNTISNNNTNHNANTNNNTVRIRNH